jgi:hypothetical protein
MQASCTILAMVALLPIAQLLFFHIILIQKVSHGTTVIQATPYYPCAIGDLAYLKFSEYHIDIFCGKCSL